MQAKTQQATHESQPSTPASTLESAGEANVHTFWPGDITAYCPAPNCRTPVLVTQVQPNERWGRIGQHPHPQGFTSDWRADGLAPDANECPCICSGRIYDMDHLARVQPLQDSA